MGKVRGSKTLRAIAKAAGAPANIANQVVLEYIGEPDLTKRFVTLDKLEEERFRNDRACLNWFLALAYGVLDDYTSEQVAQGFADFLSPIRCTSKPSRAAILKLVRETFVIVDGFLRDRVTGHIEFELSPGRITRSLEWFGGSTQASYHAGFRVAFLMRLTDLLHEYDWKLRHCAAASCGRLFFANKRQIFCRDFCSRTERTRRLMAKRSPAQRREKRREYYKNQVEKKYGKTAAKKIRHRPEITNGEVQS
jgi:hypothetical protein